MIYLAIFGSAMLGLNLGILIYLRDKQREDTALFSLQFDELRQQVTTLSRSVDQICIVLKTIIK
jgi:hypothetical protein